MRQATIPGGSPPSNESWDRHKKRGATASFGETAPLSCCACLLDHEPRNLRIQWQFLHVQRRSLHAVTQPVDIIRVRQINTYEGGTEFAVVLLRVLEVHDIVRGS